MCRQVRPLEKFLTNYVAILRVDVCQPQYKETEVGDDVMEPIGGSGGRWCGCAESREESAAVEQQN